MVISLLDEVIPDMKGGGRIGIKEAGNKIVFEAPYRCLSMRISIIVG